MSVVTRVSMRVRSIGLSTVSHASFLTLRFCRGPGLVGRVSGLSAYALCFRVTPSQGDKDLVLQRWIKDQMQDDLDNFLFAGSLATSNLF